MNTLGEAVMEHVAAKFGDTNQAIVALGLPPYAGMVSRGELNSAGNMYLTALSIIEKQAQEIKKLKEPQ